MPIESYWPVISNGKLYKVADAATRNALVPEDGDCAIQLDNDTLYQYDVSTLAWQIIGGYGLFVSKAGDTLSGALLFASGEGIDTVSGGGTKILNIGTDNADVINIGGAQTSTVNIIGDVINQEVTNSYITDKLFTLNSGGGASTGSGVGLEVEENSLITGYFKTSVDRNEWNFKAPNQDGIFRVKLGTDDVLFDGSGVTDTRTLTVPDASGTLGLLAASLTSGSVLFANSSGLIAQDNSNFFWDNTNKFLGLGGSPNTRLHVTGAQTAAAWTTNGILLSVGGPTVTDSSSSGAQASMMAINVIGRPTLAASSSTTYALAATFYIAGAPQNGTNASITAPYSLYVAQGTSYFLGTVQTAKSVTDGGAVDYGVNSVLTRTLTGNNSNNFIGVYAEASLATGGFNSTSTKGPTGLSAVSKIVSGAGTVTAATGVESQFIHLGSSTVSAAYGVRVLTLTNSGGGTVTAFSGLHVEDQTATTVYGARTDISSGSGKWNIYSNGTATSYIAGDITVGNTSPVANTRLSVRNSNTNAATTALYGLVTTTCSSATTYQSVCIYGDHTIAGSANNASSTASVGLYGIGRSSNTGTVAGIVGTLSACIKSSATGTVTFMYGNRVTGATSSGGTVGSVASYYSDDQTVGTNNYGYYSAVTSGSSKWAYYDAGGATSYFAGDFRVGTTTALSSAKVSHLSASTNASANGVFSQLGATVSSTGSYQNVAGTGRTVLTLSSTANDTNSLSAVGYYGLAELAGTGTGTVTGASGLVSGVINASAGVLTTGQGLRVLTFTNTSTGSIGTVVGVDVDAQTVGTTANIAFRGNIVAASGRYNLHMTGTAQNYLAGSLGVGITAPSTKLHVVDTAEQARLGYDGSNYLSITVSSAGAVTFDATGASAGFTFADDVTIGDSKNFIFNTGTGTKFGTSVSQKLAFHNATPTIQRSGAAQASVVTTSATNTTPYGYSTQAQADAIVTLVNELRAALVDKGLIKGSA